LDRRMPQQKLDRLQFPPAKRHMRATAPQVMGSKPRSLSSIRIWVRPVAVALAVQQEESAVF
jgi:hypothetical protein